MARDRHAHYGNPRTHRDQEVSPTQLHPDREVSPNRDQEVSPTGEGGH